MQTPWTVEIHPYLPAAGYDQYGNPVEGYGDPVPWDVYGWAPVGSQELTGWSSQVTADLAVYGPQPPVSIGSRDQLTVNGERFDVEGSVEDYGHGPFGFDPGVKVNLTRVAG